MSCSPVLMNDTLQNLLEGGDRGELQEGEGGGMKKKHFGLQQKVQQMKGGEKSLNC